jgi:hypothetical protein
MALEFARWSVELSLILARNAETHEQERILQLSKADGHSARSRYLSAEDETCGS